MVFLCSFDVQDTPTRSEMNYKDKKINIWGVSKAYHVGGGGSSSKNESGREMNSDLYNW